VSGSVVDRWYGVWYVLPCGGKTESQMVVKSARKLELVGWPSDCASHPHHIQFKELIQYWQGWRVQSIIVVQSASIRTLQRLMLLIPVRRHHPPARAGTPVGGMHRHPGSPSPTKHPRCLYPRLSDSEETGERRADDVASHQSAEMSPLAVFVIIDDDLLFYLCLRW